MAEKGILISKSFVSLIFHTFVPTLQASDFEENLDAKGRKILKRKKLRVDAVPSKHPKLCCPHPQPAEQPVRPNVDHCYIRKAPPPVALGLRSSEEEEEEEELPLEDWRMEMDEVSPTGPVTTAPLPFMEPPPPERDLEAEIEVLRKEKDDAVARLSHVMDCLKKIMGDDQLSIFLGDKKKVKEYR